MDHKFLFVTIVLLGIEGLTSQLSDKKGIVTIRETNVYVEFNPKAMGKFDHRESSELICEDHKESA